MFRAISDQLYHDFGNNHVQVRHEICDFIAGHKEDFAVFLVLDDEDAASAEEEDARDFETYVHNMRQDGDWGGHLELVAAARMYRCVEMLHVVQHHSRPRGLCVTVTSFPIEAASLISAA